MSNAKTITDKVYLVTESEFLAILAGNHNVILKRRWFPSTEEANAYRKNTANFAAKLLKITKSGCLSFSSL